MKAQGLKNQENVLVSMSATRKHYNVFLKTSISSYCTRHYNTVRASHRMLAQDIMTFSQPLRSVALLVMQKQPFYMTWYLKSS